MKGKLAFAVRRSYITSCLISQIIYWRKFFTPLDRFKSPRLGTQIYRLQLCVGSISAALSCSGRSADSFPEQRLVIEPKLCADMVWMEFKIA